MFTMILTYMKKKLYCILPDETQFIHGGESRDFIRYQTRVMASKISR